MIEPRTIVERDEISLYELLGLAMREGLDLRNVVVSYAGCGSHNVLVSSLEEEGEGRPPRKFSEAGFEPADGTEELTLAEATEADPLPGYGWGGERDFGVMYWPGEDKLTFAVEGRILEDEDGEDRRTIRAAFPGAETVEGS